jgi:hypothetical protein
MIIVGNKNTNIDCMELCVTLETWEEAITLHTRVMIIKGKDTGYI